MLALLLALTQAPAVTVQLNHDRYTTGDHARVYVQSAEDGYLVVLHADAAGRVRVLFPLDPTDDAFIRGGKKFEVRGRNDRDAFQIEEEDGSGTVLAAVSADPLKLDDFVRNDHWDFRSLGGPSNEVREDPLAKLTDIVQRMTGDSTGRFEYDVATYVVGNSRYAYGYDRYHYGVGYYDPFFNPFCMDPFWGWGWSCYGYGYGHPYGFGVSIGFGYRFGGRGWFFPYTRYRPFGPPLIFSTRQPRYIIPTGRSRYTPVPVRPRSEVGDPMPTRTRELAPRIYSRPATGPRETPRVRSEPRGSYGGGSRPSMSRGGSGSSGRSGGGGGRRH